MENLFSQPRQWRRTGAPFQDVLRLSAEETFLLSDIKMFMYVAEDLCASHDPHDDIVYRPDVCILKRQRRAQADIIFPDAESFLDWLNVATDGCFKDVKVREYSDRGSRVLRVMGSAQYDSHDTTKPLRLFPGYSSGDVEGGRLSSSVELTSAEWDEENNKFVHTPQKRAVHQGSLLTADVNTCFAVSWRAVAPVHCGRNKKDSLELTDFALGEIVLRYPMVWVRGDEMVGKVKPLVEYL